MAELEWQVAQGSSTLHVIDVERWEQTREARRVAGRRTYGSGPQSLCKGYPQRTNDWWWAMSVDRDEDVRQSQQSYSLKRCEDCQDALEGC